MSQVQTGGTLGKSRAISRECGASFGQKWDNFGPLQVEARVATHMSSCQLYTFIKKPFAKVIRAHLLCWVECLVLVWGWSRRKMVAILDKKTGTVLGKSQEGFESHLQWINVERFKQLGVSDLKMFAIYHKLCIYLIFLLPCLRQFSKSIMHTTYPNALQKQTKSAKGLV